MTTSTDAARRGRDDRAWRAGSLEHEGAHDPALAALATRVAEAGYLLADVAADLAALPGGPAGATRCGSTPRSVAAPSSAT